MKTETVTATPETGTPQVEPKEKNQVEKTVGKKGKTVSQGLFSDLAGRNLSGMDLISEPELPKPADPPAPVAKEEPKPEVKQGPKYLSPEDFADALVKLKVDGVEEDAKFQDIVRRVQLDKHLTLKGQKLSEEERKVREKETALSEREKVLMELMASHGEQPSNAVDNDSIVKDDPYVKRIEDQLKQTQDMLRQLTANTAPMVLQSSLSRVDTHVKETLGQSDFLGYQGKIRDYLIGLPPEQARSLDNEAGWLSVYKDLKLRELMAKPNEAPKPVPPAAQAERPAPKLVPVESGKSASSGINDDDSSKYRGLVDRAKRLTQQNSPERHKAWEEVLKFTGRASE